MLRKVPSGQERFRYWPRIAVPTLYTPHRLHLATRMQQYRNRPMDFADAGLVCLYEQMPDALIFTLDTDVQVYRSFRRQDLWVLLPDSPR